MASLVRLGGPLLVAASLWAGPAAAQTDDLILNDIVEMLAEIAETKAMAALCADATGNDPAVAKSFAALDQRNSAWTIIAVTTIGGRGGLDASVVEEARNDALEWQRYRFAQDADPAKTCRDYARSADTWESDVASGNSERTARLLEARDGKRPPIDVDASQEVADAMAVEMLHETQQRLLLACSSRLEAESEVYLQAFRDWSSRNFDDDLTAGAVRIQWGATAPWRDELIDKTAEATALAKVRLAGDAAGTCATLLAGVADGSEDLASRLPDAVARLRVADEELD
jgi:hypothetical protein